MAEDVSDKITEEELLGEAPIGEAPAEKPVEAAPEPKFKFDESPAEKRKRIQTELEKVKKEVQRCQVELTELKRQEADLSKAFHTAASEKIPLHELNRRAREIERGEAEQRAQVRELIRQSVLVGQRPGVPTRPPLFDTGDRKRRE